MIYRCLTRARYPTRLLVPRDTAPLTPQRLRTCFSSSSSALTPQRVPACQPRRLLSTIPLPPPPPPPPPPLLPPPPPPSPLLPRKDSQVKVEMEVTKGNFAEHLPDIVEAIENSVCIAFDLELSGIHRAAFSKNPTFGRRQNVEERYKEVKEAAERFQILQFGLCTVTPNKETGIYTCRPYNFYLSPATDPKFGIDREFTVQAGALEFLSENGFNFNALFISGVPYLSHIEEKWSIDREDRLAVEQKDEINVDENSKQFVADFVNEIQDWVDDPNPLYDFLNISTESGTLNAYQRRLVHQIVRSTFPNLTTLGKGTFVQVIKQDPAADKLKREERRLRFDKDLNRGIGLRHLIDALFASGKPLIGHNLFTDLINLYACFIGPLPDTMQEFGHLVNQTFPIVLDTKFLATCTPTSSHFASSLHTLWDTLTLLKSPRIDLHTGHTRYTLATHAHEAGYDALNTARVLLRIAGRYYALLMECKAAKETDAEGKAAAKLMDFLHKPDPLSSVEGGEGVMLPGFEDRFWEKWVNRLRVNGTVEGEFLLA